MEKSKGAYWKVNAEGIKPDTQYMYQLNSEVSKPDPASHFQPHGVYGPSAVVDHESFEWKDLNWHGLDIQELIFYELHVGAFTQEGTFKALLDRIKELADFGINAVELMPVSQFSGQRNWGYDGVFPFACQNSYGTPDELKAVVNECHLQGIALFIDFVYNHFGPEGNCLPDYGPYFSYKMTRWGPAINLDGPYNMEVRNYFFENTLHWFTDYHIDGIRLDAVLSMADSSPKHFLQELKEKVGKFSVETGRKVHLIAESGYNEPKVLTSVEQGGYGFDAQWLDDFQHALFALLTGEKEGYYLHYGKLEDLMEVITNAYFFIGTQENFRRRKASESFLWIPAYKLIGFSQNHDQVGNRLFGDRLIALTTIEATKLAASIVLLSPYVPLLFMGEEYGETNPFLFFTDYSDKELMSKVREGRKKEFAEFHWKGEVPDPQNYETFDKSKINWQHRYQGKGKKITSYYKALIQLRRRLPIFHSDYDRNIKRILNNGNILYLLKEKEGSAAAVIANFQNHTATFEFPFGGGIFAKILDSADVAWSGRGTSLPDIARLGDKNVIEGFNFAVFLKNADLEVKANG